MEIEWYEDPNPMPGQEPPGYDIGEMPILPLIKHKGNVVATQRTAICGYWYFLVLCDDGRLREIKATKANVLKTETQNTEGD